MNRRDRALIICLLALTLALGCNQIPLLRPTATPQPTPTPIPGWEKFEGGGAELWLPESYDGGNLEEEDLDVIREKLRNLGPDFEQVVQVIEQNPSAFAIWTFDSDIGDSGHLTNVNVAKEKVLSAITLETYLELSLKQLPAQFEVAKQDMVLLGDHEAGRVIIEYASSSLDARELLYMIKNENTVWTITYATSAEEFDQPLSVFEQSILTFAVQP